MRILIANDGFGDAGGVQSYIDAVAHGLAARGHAVAILHRDATPAPFAAARTYELPQFSAAGRDVDETIAELRRWNPDVCFSHNMDRLDLEQRVVGTWPTVKFMHGYLGTCIGGQKRFSFPTVQPCDRAFGAACVALYGVRHCGQMSVGALVDQYRWACGQRTLFASYRAVMVASEHMRREFVKNGVEAARVTVNPLFPTHSCEPSPAPPPSDTPAIVFLGRMTVLKGGDLLVRAVADASAALGRRLRLVMIGEGPQRPRWEALSAGLGVDAVFTGWVVGDERWDWIRRATLLALPSTWPEPFGLVGLEAAALGVPAVAFDVGGVREWLRPGQTGCLAAGDSPRVSTFAEALVAALGRPAELNSMRANAVGVARELSLARHLDQLEHVFSDVHSSALTAHS